MNHNDPRRGLFLVRNILIGVIIFVAAIAIIAVSVSGSSTAKGFVESEYQRAATLDASGEKAYLAEGSPSQVAAAISDVQEPLDEIDGTTTAGIADGSHFMQYSDGMIALFPYGTDQTRVMVAKDYTTGYRHYHSYVGSRWVPTPNYSGSGSDYRGGGSGSGK